MKEVLFVAIFLLTSSITLEVQAGFFHNYIQLKPKQIHTRSDANCERHALLKLDNSAIKYRKIPKGNCRRCCEIRTNDIKLKLYTKINPEIPITLPHFIQDPEAAPKHLDIATKIIIYIHGFTEITEIGSSADIKRAYLGRDEDYSVILVDWSELSSFPWYLVAVKNVRRPAKILARFLESYHDNGVLDIKNVHVIGFSLGAHVAGFIGKYLRHDLRLPRITGLDPALPGFKYANARNRLSPQDANLVDVIHTDGGRFGLMTRLGHLDFYPNGGVLPQPGCHWNFLKRNNRIHDIFSCSHNIAYKFYTESVLSPKNFQAFRCSGDGFGKRFLACNKTERSYMGFAASNQSKHGAYFLKTPTNKPFGRSVSDMNW